MASRLRINLNERSYDIVFAEDAGHEVRGAVAALAGKGERVAVIVDAQVRSLHGEKLKLWFGALPVLEVASGEASKSIGQFERLLDFLAEQRMDRRSALFAVGGGVVGDLAGFAAAAYLRGIDFYQVPTTLLAMVDSSVGGKTGVNLAAGKNLVGAFHQPREVFISTDFLGTLAPREFAAGVAEIVKYGLLGDRALFERLERTPLAASSHDLGAIIRRCCELKAAMVEKDERELAKDGGRALLNLGHTFGHAIEQVTGYGVYLHGEAVAVGLCAAARLSQKLGHLSAGDVQRVEAVVAAHALPARLRQPLPLAGLLGAMARDKKVRAGLPRFVVMTALGNAVTQDGVAPEHVEAAFREVGAA